MLRKVLLSLASLFLAYQSVRMMDGLVRQPQELHWGLALFLGYLFTLFVTGVFAFVGFAFPTHRLLPASYFIIRNPQRLQRVYDHFGLPIFKKFLLIFFWGKKAHQKRFFNGQRSGLAHLEFESKQAETGHLLPFVLLTLAAFVLLGAGYDWLVVFILLINLIGNAYPVVLQRHHRMRLQKLQNHLSHKKS